jgi:hypothetical protein
MNQNLRDAVITQLDYEPADLDAFGDTNQDLISTLQDIATHGIHAGFNGFIYYADTVAFAEEHRTDILAMAREMADDLGLDGAYSLIAGFNCLGDDYTTDSVADAIHDPEHEDYTQVMNALSWFAAEEVARELTDSWED